jgi:AraC-like DNA-binding protein
MMSLSMDTSLTDDCAERNRADDRSDSPDMERPAAREDSLRIRYVELDPAVSDYVSALFVLQAGSQGIDDILEPDWGTVGFALEGSWTWSRGGSAGGTERLTFGTLFGPMDRAAHVTATPRSRTVGMTLTPLGWSQLVGLPASDLVGRSMPVADLFDEASELLENLAAAPDDAILTSRLVRWLTRRIRLAPAADPHIRLIASALDDELLQSVEDLAARTGLTTATLDRLCPVIFGFTPNKLLERQRFLRALRQLQLLALQGDPSGFHGDYADAATFDRIFTAVMGLSVADYLASPRRLLIAGLRAAGLVDIPTLQSRAG